MKQVTTDLPEIKLIGITTRTNNANEADATKAKIGPTVQRYFHEALASQIQQRRNPDVTYCVYTEAESNYWFPDTFEVLIYQM